MTAKFLQLFVLYFFLFGNQSVYGQQKIRSSFQFHSSNSELERAISWAKEKALSYAHDNSDPVGYWYEAALPNREAFCMRDVCHQSIGAEVLGLSQHNLNMLLKFSQNISESKDYASFWEINRYNKPAPVDYENDTDFWYNLPANFDLIYTYKRLYDWTGNKTYLTHQDFQNFAALSLDEYVMRWALSSQQITKRDRALHVQPAPTRFGKNRGIPTYNEGGRGESLLGIDMTASYIAALSASIELLKAAGKTANIDLLAKKKSEELAFLNSFWWDVEKEQYKSIYYKDQTFDYFRVGKDQAYLHYLLYFDVLDNPQRIQKIIHWYEQNHTQLIVELKSYLPILFYQNNLSDTATEMLIELCNEKNLRRAYPENSFTIIEHITRGLMGVEANAQGIETRSRITQKNEWAHAKGITIRSSLIDVKHFGKHKTQFSNRGATDLYWKPKFEGHHPFIWVNNQKIKAIQQIENGLELSYTLILVPKNESLTAEIKGD
jgi:hypothetical protein